MQGTIRLGWVAEGRYPLSRLEHRCYHPFADHVIKGALYLFPVLDRYLPPGMLDRGTVGVSPDGVGPRHVPYSIEGVWEACFRVNMSLTKVVDVGEVALVNFGFESWLGLVVGTWEACFLKAGIGCSAVVGGLLH